MNKKNRIVVIVIIFILLIIIGKSYALFTSNDSFVNRFKTMLYNIDITEEFEGKWGTKKVYFTNNDSSNTSVVLRINYNEAWNKNVGSDKLVLSNYIDNQNVVNKEWTNTFNNDFVLGNDGWYYYKKILNSGDQIQVLNSISLNENLINASGLKNDYLSYDYQLSFNYEAIEADKNNILEIWGKNVTINGSNVIWQ